MRRIWFQASGDLVGLQIPPYAEKSDREDDLDAVCRAIARRNEITLLHCRPLGEVKKCEGLVGDHYELSFSGRTVFVVIPKLAE